MDCFGEQWAGAALPWQNGPVETALTTPSDLGMWAVLGGFKNKQREDPLLLTSNCWAEGREIEPHPPKYGFPTYPVTTVPCRQTARLPLSLKVTCWCLAAGARCLEPCPSSQVTGWLGLLLANATCLSRLPAENRASEKETADFQNYMVISEVEVGKECVWESRISL